MRLVVGEHKAQADLRAGTIAAVIANTRMKGKGSDGKVFGPEDFFAFPGVDDIESQEPQSPEELLQKMKCVAAAFGWREDPKPTKKNGKG